MTTTSLTPQDTGRWRITTQGSVHEWDLDAMTWTRSSVDGLNPMSKDGRTVVITAVERWPAVGSVFFVWCTERPQQIRPDWHQSSIVRSIERITP